jgi:hypothetical protein
MAGRERRRGIAGVDRMRSATVRKHALSLPEVTEQPHFDFTSFRVRGKIFVTMPPDEKHVHVFVGEEHRKPFATMYPQYISELPWGKKIVGLRIALAKADTEVVKELINFAWQNKAPKSLQAELDRDE